MKQAILEKELLKKIKNHHYQKYCAPGIFSIIIAPFSAIAYYISDDRITNPEHIKQLKNIGKTVYTSNLFIADEDSLPIDEQLKGFRKKRNTIIGLSKYTLEIDEQYVKNDNKKMNEISYDSELSILKYSLTDLITKICQNLNDIGEPCKKIETTNFMQYEKYFLKKYSK